MGSDTLSEKETCLRRRAVGQKIVCSRYATVGHLSNW